MKKIFKNEHEYNNYLVIQAISNGILLTLLHQYNLSFHVDEINNHYVCYHAVEKEELKKDFYFSMKMKNEEEVEFSLFNPDHIFSNSYEINDFLNMAEFVASAKTTIILEYFRLTGASGFNQPKLPTKKEAEIYTSDSTSLKKIVSVSTSEPIERVRIVYDDNSFSYLIGFPVSEKNVGDYILHEGDNNITVIPKNSIN